MSPKVGVGYSQKSETREAIAEAMVQALKGLDSSRIHLAMAFSTSKHDAQAMKAEIRKSLGPQAKIIGGRSVGTMTNTQLSYLSSEVGIALLEISPQQFDLLHEENFNVDEFKSGQNFGRKLKEIASDDPSLLIMYDSIKQPGAALNMATPMIAGFSESIKKHNHIAGLGMLGDLQFNFTQSFFDDKVTEQSLIGIHFKNGISLDSVIIHGCKPSGTYHMITKTDGPVILEINGKRAIDVVSELLGPNSGKTWKDFPLFVIFGINKGQKFDDFKEENYANRLCMAIDEPRGGLVMFEPDLKPGMEIQLMRRSIDASYIATSLEKLKKKTEGKKTFFYFYIDCAGRAMPLSGVNFEEGLEVQKQIGLDVPLLGVYSGVEISKVGPDLQALDWTGVLCALSC